MEPSSVPWSAKRSSSLTIDKAAHAGKHERVLCQLGHLWETFGTVREPILTCPGCGEPIVWIDPIFEHDDCLNPLAETPLEWIGKGNIGDVWRIPSDGDKQKKSPQPEPGAL